MLYKNVKYTWCIHYGNNQTKIVGNTCTERSLTKQFLCKFSGVKSLKTRKHNTCLAPSQIRTPFLLIFLDGKICVSLNRYIFICQYHAKTQRIISKGICYIYNIPHKDNHEFRSQNYYVGNIGEKILQKTILNQCQSNI